MILFRSFIFFLFLSVTIIIYTLPIAIFGWVMPYKAIASAGRYWGRMNVRALELLCGLTYRIHGKENLPSSNCIVLCNHQSAWETIALRAILPPEHTWVVKQELLWVPFFGWAIAPFRPIAIDRRSGRRALQKLLSEGKRWLRAGRWIVIFPEGTRVAPGDVKPFGIGGAMLAQKTGYAVLPIAHNAGVFWRRRELRKYPGTIDMVIGKPITSKGISAAALNREVEAWIRQTVAHLPGEKSEAALVSRR